MSKAKSIVGPKNVYLFTTFVFVLISVLLFHANTESVERAKQLEAKTDSLKRAIDAKERKVRLLRRRVETLSQMETKRVRWLTRAMMSETNDLIEARYVAHVIDNRAEHPSFPDTPREVILDCHGQYCAFSAFNYNRDTRYRYIHLTEDNARNLNRYRQYRRVARRVLRETERDPTRGATHFYSPRSMRPAYSAPQWAYKYEHVDTPIPNHRFRFYRMSAS